MHFMGYRREDGQVGVRNLIGIISTVFCANKVTQEIARQTEGAVSLCHPLGCGQFGEDMDKTIHTLIACGCHPNFAAVVVVGLGCERASVSEIADAIEERTRKPVGRVVIQEEGDSLKAIDKGVRIAKSFREKTCILQRSACALSELTVAVKCGGSDATSGLAANPAVGAMSDMLIEQGGSIYISEVSELFGAEKIIEAKAINEEVAEKIRKAFERDEKRISMARADTTFTSRGKNRRALISTGNMAGGLSTVAEKALGNWYKAGTKPIQDVLYFASGREEGAHGLFFMDAQPHDGEVVTGMVCGGAQITVFTTGRGTPAGLAFAPVLKVTGNRYTYEKMKENIDMDTSRIIDGTASVEELGAQMLQQIIEIASGKLTKAELLGHDELFCITRTFG